MLSDAVTAYVDLRRATGFKYRCPARLLTSFAAFAAVRGDAVVRTATVLEWAALAPSPQQRRNRLLTVRRCAVMLHAEDPRHEVPPADALGHATVKRRSPYIYTPEEVSRLVQAAARLRPQASIKPAMYATLFGLLAATGLRVSEALALRCHDVTEDGLIIRNTKFRKSRLVPLHETTRKALDAYLAVRRRHKTFDDTLFVATSGRAPSYNTVGGVFRRLARAIGLRNEANRRGPRIHDLRHTFAVRSLEQCGPGRDDVARHMVALSTYMGHAKVAHTYWYLEATPILMRQIAEAAETLHRGGHA